VHRIYFHFQHPRKERPTPLPWHVLYDGSRPLLHPSNKLESLAQQETPTPSGIANMDYFHSPPDVASPLRRLLMATISSQLHD
jgi:hypothetical protein